MSLALFTVPRYAFQDDDGGPASGWLLYSYEPGTTTAKATYQDREGASAHTNPIVLDSRGEATIYTDGLYKFVLKTPGGVTKWTEDNIGGVGNGLQSGYLTKNVAGSSNVTLTASEQSNAVIEFTGLLTGNINVTVGDDKDGYRWTLINNTTGSFTLTLKTTAGTGPVIPQGAEAHVYHDGADIVHDTDAQLDGLGGSTVGKAVFTAADEAAAQSALGLGSAATQDATAVNIDGGAIDGTPIGANSPSTGKFTALEATGVATFSAGSAASPSQVASGDANTGPFWKAADTYAIATAGAERVSVDSAGSVLSGAADSTPWNNSGNSPAWVIHQDGRAFFAAYQTAVSDLNRLGNDGTVITFSQDGTAEGSITVSGTTVSLTGAHLTRWSQWDGADYSTHPNIPRGTVLSNRNSMCEWLAHEWIDPETGAKKHELYDGPLNPGDTWDDGGVIHTVVREANEQLNRTAVSTAPGDRAVAGVFQGYDQDDIYAPYDFHVAMVGDFVIRVGAGVVVQNGDLLESAGDGTARPQIDDIRRSSTVAKVTSTSGTETYPDGSYLVPCVLMCA